MTLVENLKTLSSPRASVFTESKCTKTHIFSESMLCMVVIAVFTNPYELLTEKVMR